VVPLPEITLLCESDPGISSQVLKQIYVCSAAEEIVTKPTIVEIFAETFKLRT
jgi:hypothetical protein